MYTYEKNTMKKIRVFIIRALDEHLPKYVARVPVPSFEELVEKWEKKQAAKLESKSGT